MEPTQAALYDLTLFGVEHFGILAKAKTLANRFGSYILEDAVSDIETAIIELANENPAILEQSPGYLLTGAYFAVLHDYEKSYAKTAKSWDELMEDNPELEGLNLAEESMEWENRVEMRIDAGSLADFMDQHLTPEELAICKRITRGDRYPKIGKALGLSTQSIYRRVQIIRTKLGSFAGLV